MKPPYWLLAASFAFSSLCGGLHAQTAFNLSGQIVSGTCQWSISDVDSVVVLDPIPLTAVPASGAVGFKPFQLTVSQCTADLSKATFTFSGTPDISDPLRYQNTGTATGMAIELQSADGQTIGANGVNSARTVPVSGTLATLPLRVAYWHPAGTLVTVGTVESAAVVTMSYQ
ncbi:fimbrial protein [Dyella japonica]|uniref:Type 1 fimbria pilin n=1 Tax=Dyella japonica TaxID=231455 RepID=A0ABV2K0V9_9GAMM